MRDRVGILYDVELDLCTLACLALGTPGQLLGSLLVVDICGKLHNDRSSWGLRKRRSRPERKSSTVRFWHRDRNAPALHIKSTNADRDEINL